MTNEKRLSLWFEGESIDVEILKFPAGESLVRMMNIPETPFVQEGCFCISLNFKDNGDLIDLLLLTNAIREGYGCDKKIILSMNYLPYARQDRVCNRGESLSIKVIAGLINSQKYHSVVCMDIHSDVGAALIGNVVNLPMAVSAGALHNLHPNAILVSPDAGANKKVLAFAKTYQYAHVVRADKTRDPLTGNITGTEVFTKYVGDQDFLILDDICDGGKTFIELAKQLKKYTHGKIYLYVTHGVFSKGYDELSEYIDRIYVSNLMGKPNDALVTVL